MMLTVTGTTTIRMLMALSVYRSIRTHLMVLLKVNIVCRLLDVVIGCASM